MDRAENKAVGKNTSETTFQLPSKLSQRSSFPVSEGGLVREGEMLETSALCYGQPTERSAMQIPSPRCFQWAASKPFSKATPN